MSQDPRPSQYDLLEAAFDQWNSKLFCMLPGRIVLYDYRKQKADIEPLLRRSISAQGGEVIIDTLETLKNVQVNFLRGGSYFSTTELSIGDPVTLQFCDQPIDEYKTAQSIAPIESYDLMKHGINNAVAVPGWYPFAKSITEDISQGIVIGKEGLLGVKLRVRDELVQVTTGHAVDSTGGFVALSEKIDVYFDLIFDALINWPILASDGGAALKTYFAAAMTTASVSYPLDTTASLNLKADEIPTGPGE